MKNESKNCLENRIAGNQSGTEALKSLLQMMTKGRISVDPRSIINISLNIRGSEREFNRMVNSLSSSIGAFKVEKRSTTSAGHPGIWMNRALVSSQGVAVEILQQAH